MYAYVCVMLRILHSLQSDVNLFVISAEENLEILESRPYLIFYPSSLDIRLNMLSSSIWRGYFAACLKE